MHPTTFIPRRMRHARLLLALAACAVLAPSIGSAADPAPTTADISKFAFTPKEITVAPGAKVRWVNHDEIPHTVTSAQGQEMVMASKALDVGDSYEASFAKEGDYAYVCSVHPFMTGVVHVRKK